VLRPDFAVSLAASPLRCRASATKLRGSVGMRTASGVAMQASRSLRVHPFRRMSGVHSRFTPAGYHMAADRHSRCVNQGAAKTPIGSRLRSTAVQHECDRQRAARCASTKWQDSARGRKKSSPCCPRVPLVHRIALQRPSRVEQAASTRWLSAPCSDTRYNHRHELIEIRVDFEANFAVLARP